MIEKRFEVDVDNLLLVWDTEKNKRLEIEDIVDLLNALHEENEKLRKQCFELEKDYLIMSENRIVISDTLLRLLVCIAVSHRGLTGEEWQFMRRLEKELFDDE